MVRLSRCQQRNKNIENLIVNLRELAVDEVKFKIEIELDYGSLSLDNIKLKDLQVKDLAVNTYRKHLEISKLPRALSKMTQIEAFNWLQTQVRLDQKLSLGSIQRDRVAFGDEEMKPSFWNNEVLPWTNVTKTFKNLNPAYPGLINKVKEMIKIRLNLLGKNPESYVVGGNSEDCFNVENVVRENEAEIGENVNVGGNEAVVDDGAVDENAFEEEAQLESSRAARTAFSGTGGSPRAQSDSGSVSTEEEDGSNDSMEDSNSNTSTTSGPNDTLKLAKHKMDLEDKLATAMLGLNTSSSSSGSTLKLPEKPKTLKKFKCQDCVYRAKSKTALEEHIKVNHPFSAMSESDEEKTPSLRKSKRPRKTTKRENLQIFEQIYRNVYKAILFNMLGNI